MIFTPETLDDLKKQLGYCMRYDWNPYRFHFVVSQMLEENGITVDEQAMKKIVVLMKDPSLGEKIWGDYENSLNV